MGGYLSEVFYTACREGNIVLVCKGYNSDRVLVARDWNGVNYSDEEIFPAPLREGQINAFVKRERMRLDFVEGGLEKLADSRK